MEACADRILVCGLGRLGRHCVAALRPFGVPLHGVDVRTPEKWHDAETEGALKGFTAGDCRSMAILQRAGVADCRSVVLVTGSDRVNVAAAIAVRALNPKARIVIRSRQRNLNRLLSQQLGNFVALDPALLAAPALALAAIGGDTVGSFRLDGELVRVLRRDVAADPGSAERKGNDPHGPRKRLLDRRGDAVTWVEIGDDQAPRGAGASAAHSPSLELPAIGETRRVLAARWAAAQITRVAVFTTAVIGALYLTCALLYRVQYPDIETRDAFNAAMVLVLGGYDNLFGQLRVPFPIPLWLHAFSVLVSASGTVGIGIVYAFLTERVLSVRFQLFVRHPRPPRHDHVVLLGLGPVGLEVADALLRAKRPVLALSETPVEPGVADRIPVLVGPLEETMKRAHLGEARSVVALGDDDIDNLEATLSARAVTPNAALVLCAHDVSFRENVAQLVPGARVLALQAVAAEAFAGAAFGENIHALLHVDDETVLVTEYHVDTIDTLHDRLVGEVAYGYGLVPLLLRRGEKRRADFFPSDDIRLRPGDELVVLASPEALRRVEGGDAAAPSAHVRVSAAPTEAASFQAALAIARMSGCDVAMAQNLMGKLPAVLPTALYARQAERLVAELRRIAVDATVIDATAKREAPDETTETTVAS